MKLAFFLVFLFVMVVSGVPVEQKTVVEEAPEVVEDQKAADDLQTDASSWGWGGYYRPSYYGGWHNSYYRPHYRSWGGYGGWGGYPYGGYRHYGGWW